eukprot:926244-Alexandrium_andersonii.AAC.1
MKALCSNQWEQGHTAGPTGTVGSELRRHLVTPSSESQRPASSAGRPEADPDEAHELTTKEARSKRRNK